ncbi:DNA replication/repair protein RecF [Butyricicoccus sp.]|uniref:DNA replication/repair protein RecF n=1 Tax=Butyricicoccus sp. TaxID=2049021 RepID=UPI003F13FA81
MNIERLTLRDFRNYASAELVLSPGVNVFCGENAQGKTNILEAVGLLSTMRLFRSGQKRDAIRFGAPQAEAEAQFFAEKRDMTIRAVIPSSGRVQLAVNGVKQKRLSDGAGILRSVLFCPEDLMLIREGAAARRRFMDIALSQLRPNYARYLAEYARLHENKIRILKDSEEKPSLLDTLDDFSFRMSMIGGHIVRYRAYYLRALMQKARGIHASISGRDEQLDYVYRTVSTVADPFASAKDIGAQLWDHACTHRAAEIAAKSCLSGPHKDDLELTIGGKSAKAFGSQGQVRTCALSLKLAERDMFFDDSGEYPVLLLDDVLSELDAKRQDFVLNRIENGQVLITCCEPEKLAQVEGGRLFSVENGTVCETC